MSLTVAGTDLGGSNYGLVVHAHTVPMLASPRVYAEQLSAADGVAIQGRSKGALMLKFGCAISGTSNSDAETKAANLASFFNTRIGTTYTLVWAERPTVTYTVTLVSKLDMALALSGALFELEFIVPTGAAN